MLFVPYMYDCKFICIKTGYSNQPTLPDDPDHSLQSVSGWFTTLPASLTSRSCWPSYFFTFLFVGKSNKERFAKKKKQNQKKLTLNPSRTFPEAFCFKTSLLVTYVMGTFVVHSTWVWISECNIKLCVYNIIGNISWVTWLLHHCRSLKMD